MTHQTTHRPRRRRRHRVDPASAPRTSTRAAAMRANVRALVCACARARTGTWRRDGARGRFGRRGGATAAGRDDDDGDDDGREGRSFSSRDGVDDGDFSTAKTWARALGRENARARGTETRRGGDDGGAKTGDADASMDEADDDGAMDVDGGGACGDDDASGGTRRERGTAARMRRKTRRDWSKVPDAALPRVAVVGRPNVGKSALFNRLTGTKRAIVYDEPGVTRDRMYTRSYWGESEFMMVDTGGFENLPRNPEGAPKIDRVGGVEILPAMIEAQAAEAVKEAAVLVFVVDGQVGLTEADRDIYRWLRRSHSDKPLHLAVNKCESTTKGEEQIIDFWQLGDVTPLAVSAISGTGTGDLLDNVCATLPQPPQVGDGDVPEEEEEVPVTLAIIGRPNVGKSSLLNGLAGEMRSIVSDFSGTTRDSIDTMVEDKYTGKKYTLIDTAGIRRRTQVKSGSDGAEKLSVGRALQAMKRADVVCLVIDATQGPSQQDFVLAERATQEGCALVLCINKWDLVDKDTYTMNKYTDEMRLKLRVFEYAEIVYTSALTGQRIQKILDAADIASVNHRKRLTTATLNSVVQEATLWKLPPSRNSRKGKIYYITQASIRPPTFVFFVNDPKLFPETYRRYMERQLRENIGFPGTPIRLLWRGKGVEKVAKPN